MRQRKTKFEIDHSKLPKSSFKYLSKSSSYGKFDSKWKKGINQRIMMGQIKEKNQERELGNHSDDCDGKISIHHNPKQTVTYNKKPVIQVAIQLSKRTNEK